MTLQIVLFFSAVSAFVGTLWQCALAIVSGIESMEGFLRDHNALRREELKRALGPIPRWRLFKRRRKAKKLTRDLDLVLTDQELRTSRAYDRQALGWAFLLIGSSLAVSGSVLGWGV